MTPAPVRLGIAGLGLAATMVLDGTCGDPRVMVTGGADPDAGTRRAFTARTGAPAHASVEDLCAAPDVDAVWVATPTRFHRAHVEAAAAASKHVVVEKPMAPSLADCDAMIAAAQRAGVVLIAGGVRSLDPAFAVMRAVIGAGAIGRLRHVAVSAHTGWMRRERTPAEMDETLGGGIVFNQAPHGIDTIRLIADGRAATSVHAATAAWTGSRVGHFRADLTFADRVTATLTYDGYGYLRSTDMVTTSGDVPSLVLADAGLVIASGSTGAVRPAGDRLHVVGDDGAREVPVPPGDATTEAVSELVAALGPRGTPPRHSGEWGRATLEIVVALLESARTGERVPIGRSGPGTREDDR